jgi:hypothetical protein
MLRLRLNISKVVEIKCGRTVELVHSKSTTSSIYFGVFFQFLAKLMNINNDIAQIVHIYM